MAESATNRSGVTNAQRYSRTQNDRVNADNQQRRNSTQRHDPRMTSERFTREQAVPRALTERFRKKPEQANTQQRTREYMQKAGAGAAAAGQTAKVQGDKKTRNRMPTPARTAARRADWVLIGASLISWYWTFVFGVICIVFIGAAAVGEIEIAGGVTIAEGAYNAGAAASSIPIIGPALSALKAAADWAVGGRVENVVSPTSIAYAFWGLTLLIVFLSYTPLIWWYARTGRNPFGSYAGWFMTIFCIAGSMTPGVQLFPWITAWTGAASFNFLSSTHD